MLSKPCKLVSCWSWNSLAGWLLAPSLGTQCCQQLPRCEGMLHLLLFLVIRVGRGMGASCSPRSPFQLQDFSLAVLVREAVRGDCAGLCF